MDRDEISPEQIEHRVRWIAAQLRTRFGDRKPSPEEIEDALTEICKPVSLDSPVRVEHGSEIGSLNVFMPTKFVEDFQRLAKAER